jgi:hypothetical protein
MKYINIKTNQLDLTCYDITCYRIQFAGEVCVDV